MKKRYEFCEICQKETKHAYKKKTNRKPDGTYSTYALKPKCLVCGYRPGDTNKIERRKKVHLSFR